MNNVDLVFLEPWREALRGCLVPSFHDSDAAGEVAFSYGLDPPLGLYSYETELKIIFPVDKEHGWNRERLQRIREAMELCSVLAMISKNVFVEFMGELIPEDPEVLRTALDSARCYSYRPVWFCRLDGKLPPDDPRSVQPRVTWGELLGCPDDPWHYSSEFRAAMNKLEVMLRKSRRKECCVRRYTQWKAETDALTIFATEETPIEEWVDTPWSENYDKEEIKVKVEGCVYGLGELLKANVPPIAHLSAVGDAGSLIAAWKQSPRNQPVLSGIVEIKRVKWAGNDICAVTAALAQSSMKGFKLAMNDSVDTGLAAVNAGLLMSTIICRRSIGGASRENHFSLPEPLQRCGSSEELDAQRLPGAFTPLLYSAIAEAPLFRLVKCQGYVTNADEATNRLWWQWMAYALVGRSAKCSVVQLAISQPRIRESDVNAVSAVLENSYPEPTLGLSSSTVEYGFVKVQAGTRLRLIGFAGNDDKFCVIPQESYYRARHDRTSTDYFDVVVPGYGICKLKTDEGANLFAPDKQTIFNSRASHLRGLQVLIIYSAFVENDAVMSRMLSMIGARLRLLIIYQGDLIDPINIDLSPLAAACPRLQCIKFHSVNVNVSDCAALRNWKIEMIHIFSIGHKPELLPCLEDPSYRMARGLVHLYVILHNEDREYMDKLNAHNGDFLPVIKEKLPIRSKLAMISVVAAKNATRFTNGERKAIHHLDAVTLGLVFEFASTPKQRFVKVAY